MDTDAEEEERLRAASLKNAESIRIARQRAERELLAAKESLEQKNAELQQQRAWFEVTLASIGDAVITTDVNARVTYLNPIAETMTGWTSAEARGEPLERIFRIVNEFTRQTVDNPVGKVLQTGKIVGLANHTALIDRNGRGIPIEDSAAPIRDAHGTLAGAVMVFHDVSARRLAEDALRASQARLRATFDQAAMGIVVSDLNGQFVESNRRFCDLLGYSTEELHRLTFAQVTDPDDLPETQAQTRALLAGQVAHCAFETRYVRKDGSGIWGRTTLTPLSESGAGAPRFIGTIEDITDRKKAEQALSDARALAYGIRTNLAAIVESSDDAIISKRLDGTISTWNYGAERMFGYTAAEIIGKPITVLFPPEYIAEEDAILQKLRRGERIEHFETVRIRKDGSLLNVSLTVSPIKDADGTVIGASKIARDITQRRLAEEVLRQEVVVRERAETSLREADRRKDEFLATLAHELRNPLAPIRQAALIFKSPAATEAQKRWSSDVINRQVQHMSLLLEDLLDISRITRGTLGLRTQTVILDEIVQAAIEPARPIIDSRRHAFAVELPAEPVHFVADPLRLAQVLSNLLTNAAKYTDPQGTLLLRAACTEQTLTISVIDNGIGLAPEATLSVFAMFSQVASSHDRAEGGLGIGLALAKGLVELHGGTIEARSAGIGHGSEFIVRLPLRKAAVSPQNPVTETGAAQPASRRVLIADDNSDSAESLATLLRLDGHEVAVVRDGHEALALWPQLVPEVALLDIGMPGMSGYEVAQRVRQADYGRTVMLIAATGWGQAQDRVEALAAGFDHHFTKPIDPDRLRELLRRK